MNESQYGPQHAPKTAYLTGKIPLGRSTILSSEIDGNQYAPAFQISSVTKIDNERFHFSARPELRYYGKGFAGGWRGHTQQVYTGYDLQSLSYTNAINIFRTSDAAFVPAARVIAEWQAFLTFSFYRDQEGGQFDFRDAPRENYYFWDAGIRAFPTLPRQDYATTDAEENKPRFTKQLQFVVTLHSSF